MSGCVGSPTNGSENDRRASGRGDASIGPSWAPCEVSAELSIVGAASGGSDARGRRELIKASSELSKARCAHSSPSDSGGKAYRGCAATQGEDLRAQRRVSGEGAALIWAGVGGECPAWQRSALASCGNVVLGKSEALRILDHGARSGSAAEALQGAHGADVVKRRRRQGDDGPGRLDRRIVGMEGMRWAGTHDGERLQRDVGQFRYNDRQVQNLDQDCAGRGHLVREVCSLHTRRDVQSLPLDACSRVLFRVCRGCLGLDSTY